MDENVSILVTKYLGGRVNIVHIRNVNNPLTSESCRGVASCRPSVL